MDSYTAESSLPLLEEVASHCWNRIGVQGDCTCPELPKYMHCRNCPIYVGAGAELFEREPPADWLQENTKRLAENDTPLENDTITVLSFRIADEWLALTVPSVVEAAEPLTVHRVPHRTSAILEGVVNIRGELQLCVSLAKLLHLPALNIDDLAELPQVRFLVTEHGRQRWVFPVDEVSGVHRLAMAQRTELPATIRRAASRLSRHVYDWNDKFLCHLDADRVFAAFQRGLQ
jgi:chemotaxis-related protein WspD